MATDAPTRGTKASIFDPAKVRFYSRSEICNVMNISPSTLGRMIKAGEFPQPVWFGRQMRFRRDEVEAFLAHGVWPLPADASPPGA